MIDGNEIENKNFLHDNIRLFLIPVICSIFFDYLFYEKELGVSYSIFTFLLFFSFFKILKKYIDYRPTSKYILFLPIILLSSTFFVHNNSFFLFINFLLVPCLSIYQMCLLISHKKYNLFSFEVFGNIFKNFEIIEDSLKPILFFYAKYTKNYDINDFIITIEEKYNNYKNTFDKIDQKYANLKKILIGLLVSFPLLLIILFLLSSADNIFSSYISKITLFLYSINDFFYYYISKIFDFISFIDLKDIYIHFLIISFLSIMISFYFSILFYSKNKEKELKEKSVSLFKIDSVIALTVLTLINIVYILFVFVQFSYLFSGNILNTSYNYSQYAREGFFELIVVTMINLTVFLVTINFTEFKNKYSKFFTKLELLILIFSTSVILYSSHFRLSLYENAYGYTELRLYSHLFIFFLTLIFIKYILKIFIDSIPLTKSSILMALSFYTIINYINTDSIIAKENVNRYFETKKIDMDYLQSLSYDAFPEIKRLENSKEDYILEALSKYKLKLKKELEIYNKWQSFNFSIKKTRKNLL